MPVSRSRNRTPRRPPATGGRAADRTGRTQAARGSESRGGRAAERARASTRARLRASGRKLLAERGLHAVTSHDIAGAAGVAAGTVYPHFPAKEKRVCELLF